MKIFIKLIIITILIILLPVSVYCQEELWKELNIKVTILYKEGQYSEAAKVAEEALKVAETTFGSDHSNVAQSLIQLATLYQSQAKYAKVEPLYHRSLAIWEKALGKDHPQVAIILNYLAAL